MSQSEPTRYDMETCAWCSGSGHGRGGERCGVCPGTGYVMVAHPALTCPGCRCTGRDDSFEMCQQCGGAGWLGMLRPKAPGLKVPEPKSVPARSQSFEEFEEFLNRHK